MEMKRVGGRGKIGLKPIMPRPPISLPLKKI